jgi:hypothetical protein
MPAESGLIHPKKHGFTDLGCGMMKNLACGRDLCAVGPDRVTR